MHKYAIGGALLLAATHGAALSLGGTQGGAIIGRPLDILVKTSTNAAEVSEGLCLEADVQYGDTRLVPSVVSVAIQKLGDDGSGTLRIRATQPVNEPIVTITLRAGCAQKYTRNYTLLADFEPVPVAASREAAMTRLPDVAPARAVSAPVDESRPTGAPIAAAPVAVDAAPSPIRLPAPTKRPAGVAHLVSKTRPVAVPVAKVEATDHKPAQPKPAEPKPAAHDEPAKTATPSKAPAAAPAESPAAPRLKLDPVDVSAPMASTVPPPPPVQDVSPDAKKLEDMEQELRGLRTQQAKLQATLESMNTQLTRAQQQEYSNPVVYGLLGLSAAALAGLAWFWRQRRADAHKTAFPWWADSTVAPSELPAAEPIAAVAEAPGLEAQAFPSVFSELHTSGVEVHEPVTMMPPLDPTSIEPVTFEVLADLMQHVEFFDSLGQWGDAVAHLDAFLKRYPGASDLPYLLRLRHAAMQDDEAAVQATLAQYLEHFPRPGPTAYDYGVLAPGLPADAKVLEQIGKAWPGVEARRLIQHALVSRPDDDAGLHDRNLESFNELFFLHGLLDTLDSMPPTIDHVAPAPVADAGWTSVADVVRPVQGTAAPEVTHAQPQSSPENTLSSVDIDFSGFNGIAGSAPEADDPVDAAAQSKELPPLDFDALDFEFPSPTSPASSPQDKPKA